MIRPQVLTCLLCRHVCALSLLVSMTSTVRAKFREDSPLWRSEATGVRGKGIVIERWTWSWSRCTGSQPASDYKSPACSRLPLLFVRPAVTFPAAEHHRPLADTKLYCLVTEAHRCKQLAQGCYALLPRVGFEPTTCWLQVQRCTRCATVPSTAGVRICETGRF